MKANTIGFDLAKPVFQVDLEGAFGGIVAAPARRGASPPGPR